MHLVARARRLVRCFRRRRTYWAIARDQIGCIVNLAMPDARSRSCKAVAVHLTDPGPATILLDGCVTREVPRLSQHRQDA